MRILVTGAQGMLGQDLLPTLKQAGHQPIAADLRPGIGEDDLVLDITDLAAVRRAVDQEKPDAIVHGAAYTNVDGAEADEVGAYRVNALGTWNLALAAQAADIPLLYVSTDYVFDGTLGRAYDEYDATNPQSVYGRSKRAGEIHVERLCRKHYIVRTAWLYGHGGKNFVETILKAGAERPELKVVNDQWGCPTTTVDLAGAIAQLIGSGRYGTYHATGQGACTWFDFAVEILRQGGLSTPVHPQTTEGLNRPAPRPAYSVLRNRALELGGFPAMPDWKEALRGYMASRKVPASQP